MRLAAIVAISSVFLFSSPAFAQDLDVDAGTWQVGGEASFSYGRSVPSEGSGVSQTTIRVAPSIGYFVMDNLVVDGGIAFGRTFGRAWCNQNACPTGFGFGVGARYLLSFLDLPLVVPYGGGRIGMGFLVPRRDTENVGAGAGKTSTRLEFLIPLGVLIPLNEQVAIDAGVRITYNHWLGDCPTGEVCADGGELLIPVGYFGVQGFFF